MSDSCDDECTFTNHSDFCFPRLSEPPQSSVAESSVPIKMKETGIKNNIEAQSNDIGTANLYHGVPSVQSQTPGLKLGDSDLMNSSERPLSKQNDRYICSVCGRDPGTLCRWLQNNWSTDNHSLKDFELLYKVYRETDPLVILVDQSSQTNTKIEAQGPRNNVALGKTLVDQSSQTPWDVKGCSLPGDSHPVYTDSKVSQSPESKKTRKKKNAANTAFKVTLNVPKNKKEKKPISSGIPETSNFGNEDSSSGSSTPKAASHMIDTESIVVNEIQSMNAFKITRSRVVLSNNEVSQWYSLDWYVSMETYETSRIMLWWQDVNGQQTFEKRKRTILDLNYSLMGDTSKELTVNGIETLDGESLEDDVSQDKSGEVLCLFTKFELDRYVFSKIIMSPLSTLKKAQPNVGLSFTSPYERNLIEKEFKLPSHESFSTVLSKMAKKNANKKKNAANTTVVKEQKKKSDRKERSKSKTVQQPHLQPKSKLCATPIAVTVTQSKRSVSIQKENITALGPVVFRDTSSAGSSDNISSCSVAASEDNSQPLLYSDELLQQAVKPLVPRSSKSKPQSPDSSLNTSFSSVTSQDDSRSLTYADKHLRQAEQQSVPSSSTSKAQLSDSGSNTSFSSAMTQSLTYAEKHLRLAEKQSVPNPCSPKAYKSDFVVKPERPSGRSQNNSGPTYAEKMLNAFQGIQNLPLQKHVRDSAGFMGVASQSDKAIPRTKAVPRPREPMREIPNENLPVIKKVLLTPEQEVMKNSVMINLRCVTQSSKGGVALNALESDYRGLIGTGIPFKELGYDTLVNFLKIIPEAVKLKCSGDRTMMVEAVADASTAHIASLIQRQKASKSRASVNRSRPKKYQPQRYIPQRWMPPPQHKAPQLQHAAPQPKRATLRSVIVRPQSAISQPQSAMSQPQSAISQPQSAISQPQSAMSQPQSAMSQPQSAMSQPQSAMSQPQSAMSQPQSAMPFQRLTNCIAMDCEMVGAGPDGKESMIARVSIVNSDLECVYDTFVKPTKKVTDFRTAVSGVRPSDLIDANEFIKVRKDVLSIINNRTVIGHGLKHDFDTFFFNHAKALVRDTSLFPPFCKLNNGHTPSLKQLATTILGRNIQDNEHSSVEDARAAMQIYLSCKDAWEKLFIKNTKATASTTPTPV